MNTSEPEPAIAEIWRLLKRQDDQFVALNARLDKMLTTEGLTAYLGVHQSELRHLREDHDAFERTAERRFEKHESKMTTAIRWAIGAVIAGAGVIVATIGQFIQAVSG